MRAPSTSSPGVSRRLFLTGVGGTVLAIPILPSLLSRADAVAEAAENRKILVHFFTEHGGIWERNMFPVGLPIAETRSYAGFTVRRKALAATVDGGVAQLSSVLRAPSSRLTASLVAKMNLLQGLDMPFAAAHYHGATLGNYASNNGDNPSSSEMQGHPRPTIDQVMAWSSGFYSTLSGIRTRSLIVSEPDAGYYGHLSYGYSNPETRSGAIQPVTGKLDSLALFDELFPTPPSPTAPTRPPVVHRVYENYQRLRDGNRRLSAEDKTRLEEYMQRVSELERRLGTVASCQEIARPSTGSAQIEGSNPSYSITPSDHVRFFQTLNDVVVAALQCGLTRIAAVMVPSYWHTFSTVPGELWHHDIAHNVPFPETHAQETMIAAQGLFFSDVMLDLVSKLDAIPDLSGTLLDRCLVSWTQEAGNLVHQTQSLPIVTFGSADGAVRTGNYLDYRNLSQRISANTEYEGAEGGNKYFGLTLNQWFGNVLQVMGVPRSEYQEPDHDGYGVRPSSGGLGDCCNSGYTVTSAYPAAVWNVAGEALPWLTPTS